MCHNYHSYALTILNRVNACFFEQIGTRLQRVGYSGPSNKGLWWEFWGDDAPRVNPFQAMNGYRANRLEDYEVKDTNTWRQRSLRDLWYEHETGITIPWLGVHIFGDTAMIENSHEGIKTKIGGVWLEIMVTDAGGFILEIIGDRHTAYHNVILTKNFRKLHTLIAYIPKSYRVAEKWHNTPKKVVLQKAA